MSDVIKVNLRSKKLNVKMNDFTEPNALASESEEDYFQAQIDKSFEKGFEDGKNEALNNLQEEFSQKISKNFELVNNIASKLDQKIVAYENEFEQLLLEFSIAIAEKIVRREIENKSPIVEVLKDSIKKIQGANDLSIKLNPEDYRLIEEAKDAINMELFSKIKFEESENIENGGCLIQTEIGNIDARISTQLSELKKELDKNRKLVKM